MIADLDEQLEDDKLRKRLYYEEEAPSKKDKKKKKRKQDAVRYEPYSPFVHWPYLTTTPSKASIHLWLCFSKAAGKTSLFASSKNNLYAIETQWIQPLYD